MRFAANKLLFAKNQENTEPLIEKVYSDEDLKLLNILDFMD